MTKCTIYNKSLRFSRATYGVLSLISFLIQSPLLVLFTGFLMLLGSLSLKLNIPYNLHSFFLNRLLKRKLDITQKELGELNFACGMGGTVLLLSFMLFFFERWVNFGWGLVLLMSLLMFLASFASVCVGSLVYVLFKKLFRK